MIVGIDEVGRGPWAGPLVVGAVVLGEEIEGLTDSKALTKKQRESLYDKILATAAGVGLGWVHAEELDECGMKQSLVVATKRALEHIKTPYHEIIIDGTVNFLTDTAKGAYVTTMKKADLLVPSVSAASIVAKVARDEYMREQATIYPEYGFASHVGYGTAMHRAAIEQFGITPLHRRSFKPLVQYRDAPVREAVTTITTTKIGALGETAASTWLMQHGYKVVERNWKTARCEIDIVATKDGVYYFVEVKHRKNANAGGGIAAITPRKRQQMEFAARMYVHFHQLTCDARLLVITTVNEHDEVTVESHIELE